MKSKIILGGRSDGKNLFAIGGLYFAPCDIKGVAATWGISGDEPGVLKCMLLGGRPSVSRIPLNYIVSIDVFDPCGKGKQTGIRLMMRSGMMHIMDLRKEQKAKDTVTALIPFWKNIS